jgi:predicted dehydrogenase
VARQFGARRYYPTHQALFEKEDDLDAAIIVSAPDADGYPRYPELASEALCAGLHTWIGMPPCSSADDISVFTEACMHSQGKFLMAGMKRMFAPAYVRVAEIVESQSFGSVSSFAMRYPVIMPPVGERTRDERLTPRFLEFVQPYSLLLRLFGEASGMSYARSAFTGDAVVTFGYRNGVVGTLHLTGAQAPTSPLERLEVIGHGANVVVENATRLTYYRKEGRRGDGDARHAHTFLGADENAPIVWEPEYSLGLLYNKQLFIQGYVGCLEHFAGHLLRNDSPKHGNLVDILHVMTVHDKLLRNGEHEWIEV